MHQTNTQILASMVVFGVLSFPALAQPHFAPEQLDHLVDRIALYQDPLLVQVLTASTFSNQIPDAADYAGHHRYLTGDALAAAIQQDNLPWDPSVVALIPFPSVLDMMASDMAWTQQLGDAVLAQRGDVMDAVQRMRHRAYDYGYLRSSADIRVAYGPYIEILPVSPGFIFVPLYDPLVVFARPRAGFFIGGAIAFGPRIVIGASFAPWGWGGPAFGWAAHSIIVDNHPWGRTWANRAVYVHPYAAPYHRPEFHPGAHIAEHHEPARLEHERHEEHHMYREERR
jgi:hypothetical protein